MHAFPVSPIRSSFRSTHLSTKGPSILFCFLPVFLLFSFNKIGVWFMCCERSSFLNFQSSQPVAWLLPTHSRFRDSGSFRNGQFWILPFCITSDFFLFHLLFFVSLRVFKLQKKRRETYKHRESDPINHELKDVLSGLSSAINRGTFLLPLIGVVVVTVLLCTLFDRRNVMLC